MREGRGGGEATMLVGGESVRVRGMRQAVGRMWRGRITYCKGDVAGLSPGAVLRGCLHVPVHPVHHYPPHTEPQPHGPNLTMLLLSQT